VEANARHSKRRDAYVPSWPPERFIVPLLATRIAELFDQFCKPTRPNARVLDAGCGMQPFREMLVNAGYLYTSTDAVQNQTGTVDFVTPLDEPLPELMRSCPPFEFILCTEVMEHVAEWKTAFENFSQMLAPQGRLLITAPHFYPLHETPYDFWRPTPYAIEHFAKANGLRVIFMEQAGGPWEVLGTLLAETHAYPATPRLADRILAKICRVVRNLTFQFLTSDLWRKRVLLRGPYFLSVIAVLEKP